jgi:hypothetical protein
VSDRLRETAQVDERAEANALLVWNGRVTSLCGQRERLAASTPKDSGAPEKASGAPRSRRSR